MHEKGMMKGKDDYSQSVMALSILTLEILLLTLLRFSIVLYHPYRFLGILGFLSARSRLSVN